MKIRLISQEHVDDVDRIKLFFIEITTRTTQSGKVWVDRYEAKCNDMGAEYFIDIQMKTAHFAFMMHEHPYLSFEMIHSSLRLQFEEHKQVLLRLTDEV